MNELNEMDELVRNQEGHDQLSQKGVPALLAPANIATLSRYLDQLLQIILPPRSAQDTEYMEVERKGAAEFTITTGSAMAVAQGRANECERHATLRIEHLEPFRERLYRAHKQITQMKADEAQPWLDIARIYRDKAAAWLAAENKRVAAENEAKLRKAREEAEAKRQAEIAAAKAAVDAAKKEASLSGDDDIKRRQAEAERKAAAAALNELKAAPVEYVAPELIEAPKAKGAAMRENWDVEITNFPGIPVDVLRGFLIEEKPHEMLLAYFRKIAAKQKERFSIPGVRAFKAQSTLVTRKQP